MNVVVLTCYTVGDANVRTVWLCGRNDAIGNGAVMVAALFPLSPVQIIHQELD